MKYCNRCEIEKPLDDFAWRSREKGTKQPYCKPCNKTYYKELWVKSDKRKNDIRKNMSRQKQKGRDWITEYLLSNPCVDCGESNPNVLEFDHLNDKISNVSTLRRQGCSVERIAKEIEKCEVRCANCHKIITAKRGGWLIEYSPVVK